MWSQENTSRNCHVVSEHGEGTGRAEVSLNFKTGATERRQPQIPILTTQQPIKLMAEVVQPHAVIESDRTVVSGSLVRCRVRVTGTVTGLLVHLVNPVIPLDNV